MRITCRLAGSEKKFPPPHTLLVSKRKLADNSKKHIKFDDFSKVIAGNGRNGMNERVPRRSQRIFKEE